MFAGVAAGEQVAARGSEVNTTRIPSIRVYSLAQDRDVGVLLRQSVGQCLPISPCIAAAVHAQLTADGRAHVTAFFGNLKDRVRITGIHGDRIAEVAWQASRNFLPRLAAIIAAIGAVVALAVQSVRIHRVHDQAVYVVPAFGIAFGQIFRPDAAIGGEPALSAIIRAVDPTGRNSGIQSLRA